MKISELSEEHYPAGVPCKHPGCFNHVTHPCEYCGRIAGKGVARVKLTMETFLHRADMGSSRRDEEVRKRRNK